MTGAFSNGGALLIGTMGPAKQFDGLLIVVNKMQRTDFALGQAYGFFEALLQEFSLIHLVGLLTHRKHGFESEVADPEPLIDGFQIGGAFRH